MKIIKILLVSMVGVNLCYNANQSDLDLETKKHEANQKADLRLIDAAQFGDIAIVQQLLSDKSIDVNTRDEYGNTALMEASSDGNKEIVELLLKHGADVNIKGNDGNTALMFALPEKGLKESKEIVKLLLNHLNMNVNIQNNKGFTALMWAAYNGLKEAIELLLNHPSIDVNIKDNCNQTALSWATEKNHKEIIELLTKYQKEYLTYISKRLEEFKKISEALFPKELGDIVQQYAANDVMTFEQWLEKDKLKQNQKESTNKEDNTKS